MSQESLQTQISKLKETDTETLYALISQAGSTGTTGTNHEAIRETATADVLSAGERTKRGKVLQSQLQRQ